MSKRSIRERAKQRSSRRQSRWLVIGGIVIAAVLAVVALVVLTNTTNPVVNVDISRYQGLTQQLDRTGAPGLSLGDPSAEATLVEYSDFSCPHCREMYDSIHQLVDLYVRDGRLRIVYKPVFFIDPAYSPSAARAILCSGAQGKGWEMHDQIWAVYDEFGKGAYNLDVFGRSADNISLDSGQFRSCYNSAETTAMLNEISAEATEMGITSTPTLLLNGQVVSPGAVMSQVEAAVGQ